MRLIDADALPKEISWDKIENTAFWETINEQPTIDAVPVIRCRNCKYYCGRSCTAHDMPGDYLTPNDFCSWAQPKKRKE